MSAEIGTQIVPNSNDKLRLKVEHDQDAESPLTWGWDVSITPIYGPSAAWTQTAQPEGALAVVLEVFGRARHMGLERVNEYIRELLTQRRFDRYYEVVEYQGSTQSEWAYYFIDAVDADTGQLWKTFERWLNGEVYQVSLEEAYEYVNIVDSADKITRWVEIDSLGGCYLEESYTALQVAQEYFADMPEEA